MVTLGELRQKPHWSYSALHTYLQVCQLQYYFRYIEQLEPERTSACFPFGRAFHAALSILAAESRGGRNITGKELHEQFAEYFQMELAVIPKVIFKPSENKDEMIALAGKMLETVLNDWNDCYSVKGIAVPFEFSIPGVAKPVIGEFDLIVEEAQDNCIVDWKTSSCRWSASKADRELQATVFCYAFQQLNGKTPLFRFDVVTKTKTPTYDCFYTQRNQHDFERFGFIVKQVEAAVKKGVFLPNESSFACAECPYASRCRDWHVNPKYNHRKINDGIDD